MLYIHAIDTGDPRSDPRANVFLTATLYADASYPVRVRNLSIQGALVEGVSLPCEGVAVRLQRGTLGVRGEIAWRREKHCGVRFETPIDVDQWVKRAGPEGQQRIDAAIAEFRNGELDPRPLVGLPGQDPRSLLEQAGLDLVGICERLATLPNMSTELAEEIVKIDAVGQSIAKAAKLAR